MTEQTVTAVLPSPQATNYCHTMTNVYHEFQAPL